MPYEIDPFLWINARLAQPWLSPISRAFTELAAADVCLILVFLGIASGERGRGLRRAFEAFGAFALSFAAIGAVVLALKVLTEAPRPLAFYAGQIAAHQVSVHTIGPALYRYSFPSGHAASAFFAATFLVLAYGRGWSWLWILATLGALSRIAVGAHFFVDVLTGSVIGAFGAVGAFTLLRRRECRVQPTAAR